MGQISQALLESLANDFSNADKRLFSKLLGVSHRCQGNIAVYTGNRTSAIAHCKEWLGILVDQVVNYANEDDIRMLPIAYTELGMAMVHMIDNIEDVEEATKLWTVSCEMLKPKLEDQLVYPLPWLYRAPLLACFDQDGDAADRLLAPILQAREEKLGRNDTSTVE